MFWGNPLAKVEEGEKSDIYKMEYKICHKCYKGHTKKNIGG